MSSIIKNRLKNFWRGQQGMKTAQWQGQELAASDNTVALEGNDYFPLAALDMQYFVLSNHRSHCPWKGEAYYYHIQVNGQLNENAAWYYPAPKKAAAQITGHVAFWKGVEVGRR